MSSTWLTTGPDDPGYQMLAQVTLGNVDFVTGDYLAGPWESDAEI
jgi:hypothetical protein